VGGGGGVGVGGGGGGGGWGCGVWGVGGVGSGLGMRLWQDSFLENYCGCNVRSIFICLFDHHFLLQHMKFMSTLIGTSYK